MESVREKEYKPITQAIEGLGEKEGTKDLTPITSANNDLEKSVKTQLAPFQKALAYLPQKIGPLDYNTNRLEDNDDNESDRGNTTEIRDVQPPPTQPTVAENPVDTPSLKLSRDKITHLGPLATSYLPRVKDSVFGIYHNETTDSYMIGNQTVNFDGDTIIVGKNRYKGTKGLWRLLSYKNAPPKDSYLETDLKNFTKIIIDTDSMYQNNNRVGNKPKSSKGDKWISLIEPIWRNHISKSKDDIDEGSALVTGSGFLEYNNKDIEYKYISNLNELLKRMGYISSQEQAGNNNFHNEKMGILNFFYDRLQEIIDTPKAMEYMIRIVTSMPTKLLKDEKMGSGLFNTILKNIPFEIHAAGYNYLGPGTNLDERLQRGDVGVNKLDEAAKEHDIFYRDHQKTTDRHKADKVLEGKAWERLKSSDANLNERFWAFNTAAAMKVKRTFGMGIVEPKLKFQ
ncbi:hypothetical protein GE061_007786 [Apolygus lucorum]|uniref:Phospholipase A2-like domain-containing protein n=1 Tax=Apolygus lucorum TaxID=248454 RepID=A0A6A4J334_APOLU|nr:hypothetical protein GE061_007786 [Apolygus lucorum]